MMLYHFFALLIWYVGIAMSQVIYGLYQFNEVQQSQIITIHNQMRALEPASNMQELVWDQRLANLALGHAMRCDAYHRSAYERRGHGYFYIGENIWWSNEAYLRPYLQTVMLDFFREKPYYDYSTNRCMDGAQCGHYTQYIWGETCAVGCAAVHCNGIRNGRGINQGHIIICNYGEGGNIFGKRPYLYGPRCTRCQCGGPCTSEGLCPSCCMGIRYLQQSSYLHPPVLQYQCRDLAPYCKYWAQYFGCYSNYRDFMMTLCPKTCNFCYPLISAKSQVRSSVDKNLNHDFWARNSECFGSRKTYMSTSCQLSCGVCTPSIHRERRYQNNNRRRKRNSLLLPGDANAINMDEKLFYSSAYEDCVSSFS